MKADDALRRYFDAIAETPAPETVQPVRPDPWGELLSWLTPSLAGAAAAMALLWVCARGEDLPFRPMLFLPQAVAEVRPQETPAGPRSQETRWLA